MGLKIPFKFISRQQTYSAENKIKSSTKKFDDILFEKDKTQDDHGFQPRRISTNTTENENKQYKKKFDVNEIENKNVSDNQSVNKSENVRDESKWYNRKSKFFFIKLPPYSDGMSQLIMVALVCFFCPGMFNALSGLGGAGLSDTKVADNANTALYCTFATTGFFSGTICNYCGIRLTLSFGGMGYALYSASLFCYYHTKNSAFVIFAGALLGLCAACLWAAQATIMLSYPVESMKGRFIAIFWTIFNLGSVIGSIIPLAININSTDSAVSDGTYAAFLALMIVGAIIALFLLPANYVRKSDGNGVIIQKYPTLKSELSALVTLLYMEPFIILLFPMFFASNWFYSYQFNAVNAARFNIRTRSLNNLLYWLCQILGAGLFGTLLDYGKLNRIHRAQLGWLVLFTFTMVIWGGGYSFQKNYTREMVKYNEIELLDWDYSKIKYVGPMFLYMSYGVYDALFQSYAYWLIGALTNSGRKAALFAGFYKGIQSAGAAIIWRLDALENSYMSMFISSWALMAGSLLIALPVIMFKIIEFTDISKDLEFSDEIFSEVIKNSEENKREFSFTASNPEPAIRTSNFLKSDVPLQTLTLGCDSLIILYPILFMIFLLEELILKSIYKTYCLILLYFIFIQYSFSCCLYHCLHIFHSFISTNNPTIYSNTNYLVYSSV